MVDIKTVIYIVIGMLTVGGAVVAFFQMQTRQNMEIDKLKNEIIEVRRRQTDQAHYQIDTEKAIIRIEEKLDMVIKAVIELKEHTYGKRRDD